MTRRTVDEVVRIARCVAATIQDAGGVEAVLMDPEHVLSRNPSARERLAARTGVPVYVLDLPVGLRPAVLAVSIPEEDAS